jgi:hypothetical protein
VASVGGLLSGVAVGIASAAEPSDGAAGNRGGLSITVRLARSSSVSIELRKARDGAYQSNLEKTSW